MSGIQLKSVEKYSLRRSENKYKERTRSLDINGMGFAPRGTTQLYDARCLADA
jgi:hypothetical protein